ncbi:MAG: hypothetical protein RLZZ324_682 [Candidatus Parcubacteria bacterium]|jgi:hypothetical protein
MEPVTLREKFLQAFANVPVSVRDQIILVIHGQPYTWNTACLEVRQDTALGKEIVEGLKNIGLL